MGAIEKAFEQMARLAINITLATENDRIFDDLYDAYSWIDQEEADLWMQRLDENLESKQKATLPLPTAIENAKALAPSMVELIVAMREPNESDIIGSIILFFFWLDEDFAESLAVIQEEQRRIIGNPITYTILDQSTKEDAGWDTPIY